MKRLLLLLSFIAVPAFSQEPSPTPVPAKSEFDLAKYLTEHAYFTGGTLMTEGQKSTVYELRFVDDFPIAESVRGVARVSLFTLQRQGEPAPALPGGLPANLSEAAVYSDGEVWFAAYRSFNANFALECATGVTFKMTSLSGTVGDPLDGTKFGAGCGPRFSHAGNHISFLAGHYGPVAVGGKLLGFAPNLFVTAYVPLTFLGANTAFTPDFAFGKLDGASPDSAAGNVKSTMRLLVSTRF